MRSRREAVGEAGTRLVRYQRLSNDAARYEAEADATSCALTFTVPGGPDGVGAHLNVYLAATPLSFGRQLSERSWPARVRDHLRRQLSGGAPTLEECARALRTTTRSLQRWLDEAGTS